MNTADTFRKILDRFVAAENSPRADAESPENRFALGRIQEHNGANLRIRNAQLAQNFKAPLRIFIQTGAEDNHVNLDRKSTRLNSSHSQISYAVFCLKKKKDG